MSDLSPTQNALVFSVVASKNLHKQFLLGRGALIFNRLVDGEELLEGVLALTWEGRRYMWLVIAKIAFLCLKLVLYYYSNRLCICTICFNAPQLNGK